MKGLIYMCINLNGQEVRYVIPNCDSLPKNAAGKNSRVKIQEGLEHGHTYKIGVEVVYNDRKYNYNTTFQIVRLLENRNVVEVKDLGNRFGSFVLNLSSLISGSIKGKVQEQSDIYFERVEQISAPLQATIKEKDSQIGSLEAAKHVLRKDVEKQVKKYANLNEKYTKQGFELMNVQGALDGIKGAISAVRQALQGANTNKRVAKLILKQVRIATARGVKEEIIEQLIEVEINKRIEEILNEIQK